MKNFFRYFFPIIFLITGWNGFAQSTISYNGSGTYILRERTNLRRYDNGKYVGLVSREVSSYIIPTYTDNGYYYEGNFYITQDTRRANFDVGRGINDSIPAKFKIASDGSFSITQDNGFPTFRGFPTYTNQKIKIGDTWNAKAVRAIDPLNKGIVTKLPIVVQYKYVSDDVYNDEEVFVLSAQWATRYGMGVGVNYFDWGGDKELVSGQGSHKANIYVSKISGNALVIHDMVDETFEYADGNKYTFKGQISQFTEYPPAIDKYKVLRALQRVALVSDKDVKKVEKTIQEKEESGFGESGLKLDAGTGSAVALADKTDTIQGDSSLSNQINTGDRPQNNQKKTNADDMNDSWDAAEQIQPDDFDAIDNQNNLKKTNRDKLIAKLTGKTDDSDNMMDENLWEQVASDDFGNTTIASSSSKKNSKTNPTDGSGNKNVSDKEDSAEPAPLVVVEETQAGLRLTLPNLQFLPNSAQLVPGEKDRLDKIAMALKEAGDARLLIEGHTARIGTQDDEMQLSIDRAHTIAEALIQRGIPKENLLCKGSGGEKPIADNSTPEGREKNRRVEITILE